MDKLIHRLMKITNEKDLIKNLEGVREGQFIEFNKMLDDGIYRLPGAFANTNDGGIGLGISEDKGLFSAAIGITLDNLERFEKEFNDKLRSRHDKPIDGIRLNYIKLNSGKYVVIIFCPKSSDGPHQLIENGIPGMFPKRVGNSVRQMEGDEVGRAFKEKEKLPYWISERDKRLHILLNELKGISINKPSFIIHAYPDKQTYDLPTDTWEFQQKFLNVLYSLKPEEAQGLLGTHYRICGDGVIYVDALSTKISGSYMLITCKGGIELVGDARNDQGIHLGEWTKQLFALISHVLARLGEEIDVSWYFTMHMFGFKDRYLMQGQHPFATPSRYPLPDDAYDFDFIKIEHSTNQKEILSEINSKFGPKLKKVWNDAGISTEKLPKTAMEHFYSTIDELVGKR